MNTLAYTMAETIIGAMRGELPPTHILMTKDIADRVAKEVDLISYEPVITDHSIKITDYTFMGLKIIIMEGEDNYMIVREMK